MIAFISMLVVLLFILTIGTFILNHLELNIHATIKKISGCASNLLAHEDLGHLRKPIVGIYKPSSIMENSH